MFFKNYENGYDLDLEEEINRLLDNGYNLDGSDECDLDPVCQESEQLILPGGIECTHYHTTFNLAKMGGTVAVMTYVVTDDEASPAFLTDYLYEKLSDNAKRFIMTHEAGHIISGHIGTPEDAVKSVANGAKIDNIIVDNRDIKIEFVADEYAAKRNGKRETVKALKELKSLSKKNPWADIDYDEIDVRIQHLKRA